MRKEFGKWLMDIAKYITTAVLFTSFFSDIGNKTAIYVLSVIAILLSLGFGLYLVNDKGRNDRNNKYNKHIKPKKG